MTIQTLRRPKAGAGVGLLTLLCLFLTGCTATLGKAKQAAATSERVYTAVQTETVSQISALVDKAKQGGITKEERSRLSLLNDLRVLLDKYAALHNAYVSSLKVWESSGQKPQDIDQAAAQMLTLVQQAQDLAKRLNIKIR